MYKQIPNDTLEKVLEYLSHIPKNKSLEINEIPGSDKKAKFDFLKSIELFMYFEHNVQIVFFKQKAPIESSWDWESKTYTKHQIIESMKIVDEC